MRFHRITCETCFLYYRGGYIFTGKMANSHTETQLYYSKERGTSILTFFVLLTYRPICNGSNSFFSCARHQAIEFCLLLYIVLVYVLYRLGCVSLSFLLYVCCCQSIAEGRRNFAHRSFHSSTTGSLKLRVERLDTELHDAHKASAQSACKHHRLGASYRTNHKCA